jgi:tRNA C32,U32 (ribose-2'-O)-methylase TrmJ
VAVVLYELVREREPEAAREAVTMASAGDRERLVALLTEMLERSTVERESSGPTAEERVRRLIRPMALTEEEAHGWMGVVRHVLWKLKGG